VQVSVIPYTREHTTLGAVQVGDRLHIEGGGALAAALLEEDLVDRLYWIQAPLFLGTGVAAFGPRGSVPLDGASPWPVIERRPLGRDTLLVVDRALCLQG
jgi:diaminohydroxyphosphoribosylaminopyrimidine deaminase/5-amino-6-(5-phosphoribosylamino)uracil reductase